MRFLRRGAEGSSPDRGLLRPPVYAVAREVIPAPSRSRSSMQDSSSPATAFVNGRTSTFIIGVIDNLEKAGRGGSPVPAALT